MQGRTFEYLLTRFTEPNELFGPFDIRKLREGELVTNTEGMLPEASLVFLDELLNANSAILNSLLGVLNERVFRRGRETRAAADADGRRRQQPPARGRRAGRAVRPVPAARDVRQRPGRPARRRAARGLEAGPSAGTSAGPASTSTTSAQLHAALRAVDLSGVRPQVVDLVVRLRQRGPARLRPPGRQTPAPRRRQRLLCGADGCACSPTSGSSATSGTPSSSRRCWPRSSATRCAAAPADAADHPRARGDDAPDPEALARDLEDLGGRLSDGATTPADRSALRDRLGVLAGRCEWVKDERQRTVLLETVESLWPRAGGRT